MKGIELLDIGMTLGSGDNQAKVLQDITLSIRPGEFVAIVGQSGSGKSTLMNILGCLDSPTEGLYFLNGTDTAGLDADGLAALRGKTFGFIFQRYNLLGDLSALENVALPAAYAGLGSEERLSRASRLLTELGLGDKLHSRPNELSGGQQQRVSIARALMNGGEILLADEPTGALDSASGDMVMSILRDLHAKGHTIILVTHDRRIAEAAERIVEIRDGRILSDRALKKEPGAVKLSPQPVPSGGMLRYLFGQLKESLAMSVQAIMAHKMRSLLTMLGIIIGIASVVSVVALGRGSQEKILADITAMGTNTITVYPGRGFGDMRSQQVKTLSVDDARALAAQPFFDSATPTVNASGILTHGNTALSGSAVGVGEQFFDVKGITLERGVFFGADEVLRGASVAVIDQNTRHRLFTESENPLGQVILVNKQPLEVIGVAAKLEGLSGQGDSLQVWVPYSTVMHKITGKRHINSIVVKVRDDIGSQLAEKNLTALLASMHGRVDFYTMNTDSIKKTVESATGTMTLLISCIALISLVVGGIGVMNIMLVSVTERTREIGVRMSIGARRFNILSQFLIEAVCICLIGGLAGIALSYGISAGFNAFFDGFSMVQSGAAIGLALACSSLIGIFFGFIPARNASRLSPIEALARD